MLPPKTSYHSKFHRDQSNQLGDRGWSEKKIPYTDRQTHTQDTRYPDWLSLSSQHARDTIKNSVFNSALNTIILSGIRH